MKKLLLLLLIVTFMGELGYSQKDTIKQSRFDFATTTIGFGFNYSNSGNVKYVDANNQVQNFDLDHQFYPILYFGGLHFWNSTELYFALPFGQLISKNATNEVKVMNNLSSVFGIKYYPWKINNNSFRPFVGMEISGLNYEHQSNNESFDGVLRTKIVYPIQGGFSWRKDKLLLDFKVLYNYENEFEYYISQNQSATISTPSMYYSVGMKFLLDGTKSIESYHYSGKEKKDYELLKSKNLLNSFYIGVGPSTSFFTQSSEYNSEVRPFLHSPLNSNVFLDLGLGYFYEPLNAFAGIAYRNMKSNSKAYGYKQNLVRESLTLEFNKFLFDYQGFVPYLGIGISYEQLEFTENQQGTVSITEEANLWRPVFVFGWDILPTKLEYMTLRTNLRYTPNLNIDLNGYSIPNSQLEFNIIQLVFYPQRFMNFKKNNL
jgi:outer membrane protein W